MAEVFYVEGNGVRFAGESDGVRTKPKMGFSLPGKHARVWTLKLMVSPSYQPAKGVPRKGLTIRAADERGEVIGPEAGWTVTEEENLDGGFWLVSLLA